MAAAHHAAHVPAEAAACGRAQPQDLPLDRPHRRHARRQPASSTTPAASTTCSAADRPGSPRLQPYAGGPVAVASAARRRARGTSATPRRSRAASSAARDAGAGRPSGRRRPAARRVRTGASIGSRRRHSRPRQPLDGSPSLSLEGVQLAQHGQVVGVERDVERAVGRGSRGRARLASRPARRRRPDSGQGGEAELQQRLLAVVSSLTGASMPAAACAAPAAGAGSTTVTGRPARAGPPGGRQPDDPRRSDDHVASCPLPSPA